jgi:hypothetical protein
MEHIPNNLTRHKKEVILFMHKEGTPSRSTQFGGGLQKMIIQKFKYDYDP